MKYLLRNGKVEYCGNKKQLIDYVKNNLNKEGKYDIWRMEKRKT